MFLYILITNSKFLIFITGYLYEFNILNGGLVIKKNVINNGNYEKCTRTSIFLCAYYKEIDEQSILIRLQTHLTWYDLEISKCNTESIGAYFHTHLKFAIIIFRKFRTIAFIIRRGFFSNMILSNMFNIHDYFYCPI